ncbi:hypothetical protein NSE_0332 [Neorickettsia sennetsu str. Miyayama]|uniref:Uncharacterized protein n=1 Tax=Ehrlichia sennetsu (strain ATCC VR-367 / Miyayama) TaxID=222891 RepID=Q2GE75_EHRS3|nr:hypothetical protein NSE_0332 [Neorickettsia sennetsu str. Miyayama]
MLRITGKYYILVGAKTLLRTLRRKLKKSTTDSSSCGYQTKQPLSLFAMVCVLFLFPGLYANVQLHF